MTLLLWEFLFARIWVLRTVHYRPQPSWGKVMFLHVSVILFTGGGGGGIPACIAGSIPACLAGGIPACLTGGIPACLAGLGGRVSRPTPRGEVEGSGQGGLQAHTQGWGGGSPGPHLGGL